MQVNLTKDKISFKSRYEFVNINKLLEHSMAKGTVEVGMDEFKKISSGGNIFTMCLGPCTAHGLTNKKLKEASVGHFSFFANGIKKTIDAAIEKVRSFVIGGDINFLSEFFENDIEVYRNKIPTTIFWGQEKGSSNLLYNADKDICYIYKSMDEHYGEGEFVDSVEKLKKAYKIINVAEGDELCINGKIVDPTLVKQNKFNDKIYSWDIK